MMKNDWDRRLWMPAQFFTFLQEINAKKFLYTHEKILSLINKLCTRVVPKLINILCLSNVTQACKALDDRPRSNFLKF